MSELAMSIGSGSQPATKNLFTTNQCWLTFLEAGCLCEIEVDAATKMLVYPPSILSVKHYRGIEDNCPTPEMLG